MGKYADIEKQTQEIKDIILLVSMEVLLRKKKLAVSDNELLELVLNRVKNDGMSFDNSVELHNYYLNVVREIVWKCVNTDEATWIINKLKSNDPVFSRKFFYGTNPNDCNISRFRSKIISKIKKTYHVDVSIDEFGTNLYKYLWAEGTWSVLDSYSFKSSFFSWLESIAFHEIIKELKKTSRITVLPERTAGNTRIIWRSVPIPIREAVIDELLWEMDLHDFMEAKFVDLLSDLDLAERFNLTIEQQGEVQKRAEGKLRHRIINGNSEYGEYILRDKVSQKITVTADFTTDFAKWLEEREEMASFAEVFGVNLTPEECNEKVADFLCHFHEQLKWNDEDRLLWQLRYIEDTKPVVVAQILGRQRAWLDTRYCRLKKRFNEALKLWWKKNS